MATFSVPQQTQGAGFIEIYCLKFKKAVNTNTHCRVKSILTTSSQTYSYKFIQKYTLCKQKKKENIIIIIYLLAWIYFNVWSLPLQSSHFISVIFYMYFTLSFRLDVLGLNEAYCHNPSTISFTPNLRVKTALYLPLLWLRTNSHFPHSILYSTTNPRHTVITAVVGVVEETPRGVKTCVTCSLDYMRPCKNYYYY